MPKTPFPRPSIRTRLLAALLTAALTAPPAAAQLLPGALPGVGGTLPGLPPVGEAVVRVRGAVDDVAGRTRDAATGVAGSVLDRAQALLRAHPRALEPDARGYPVVRGEVLALGIGEAALQRAQAAGFRIARREAIDDLSVDAVVLAPPRGQSVRDALKRLRALDPAGAYDANAIYLESGGPGPGAPAAAGPTARSGAGLRIGLVDGSAAADTPGARLTQQAFGPGGGKVTAHATAVASLIAGEGAGFRGAAPGASVYVADVYGPTPAGGSATSIARGLGWLAAQRTPVINISLVGPPNALLQAAVARLVERGHLVVAAVGNDGPAAPPLYPAAYPGVVAVTGVDGRRRVLPEAGRGARVAFAAPGADLAAARPGGGFVGVRGTSFAAPIAAGLLAQRLAAPDPAAAARALDDLARSAVDLGALGPDAIYGRGFVGGDVAVAPTALARRR